MHGFQPALEGADCNETDYFLELKYLNLKTLKKQWNVLIGSMGFNVSKVI